MWHIVRRRVAGLVVALLLSLAPSLSAVELFVDGQWPSATTTAGAVWIWPTNLAPGQVSLLNRFWMIPPQGGVVVVGFGVTPVPVDLTPFGPGTYQFYYDFGMPTPYGPAYLPMTGTALILQEVPSTLTLSNVPARPATAAALAVSAAVQNQFGGAMSAAVSWSVTAGSLSTTAGATVTWSLPAVEGEGTITAAVDGTALVASASVDTRVSPRITQQPQATVLNPRDLQLSVRADDDGPATALTYRWEVVQGLASQVRMLSADLPARELDFPAVGSAAAQDLTVRVLAPGTFGFRAVVTDAEGHQTTSTAVQVTITAVVAALQVSPLSANLPLNGTQALTVQVQDQFGQPMVAPIDYRLDPVTFGSVTADGVFHAPGSAGSVAVIATAGGKSSSSLITVANTAPVITSLALAPAPVTGTTAAATAVASDDGTAANALNWQWSATGPASITAAPATAAATVLTFAKVGAYTVSARAQDAGGLWSTVRSTVVSVDPQLSVTLSPLAIRRNPGTTQTFTATQRDQFGDLAATGSTVAWTVSGTGATISPTGVLTLGAAATGTVTVRATLASGAQATTTVTVNAAPVVAGITIVPREFIYQPTILAQVQASDDLTGQLGYQWSLAGVSSTTQAALGGDRLLIATQAVGSVDLQCRVTDAEGQSSVVSKTAERRILEVDATQLPNTFWLSTEVYDQFLRQMATPSAVTWAVDPALGRLENGYLVVGSTPGGPYAATATCGTATESIWVRIIAPPIAIDTPAHADPAPVLGTATTVAVAAHAVTPISYQWTATGPAPVAFATASAATSTATFTQVGTYEMAVTLQAAGLPSASSTTSVTVVAVPSLMVSASWATLGQGVTLTALADQFGTPASGVTWTATHGTVVGDGVATLTPTAAGICTVTAAWAGVTVPLTLTIPVNAPPVVALATPAPVTGTSVLLQPTITDANDPLGTLAIAWQNVGNAPGMTLVTVGAPFGSATASFTAAGSYPVQVVVTDPQGASATAAATIVVQATPAVVSLSPASLTLWAGQSATAAATVADQFGHPVVNPALTWTCAGATVVGTGATAAVTAGDTAGTWPVVASANATTTAQIPLTVRVNAAPVVTLAAPGPVAGTAVVLQPTISDANDPLAALTIAWQNVGNAPGLTLVNAGAPFGAATAAFTAAGSYPVQVIVTDPQGASATAAATIVVQDTPTTITASPATISLTVGTSATAAVVVQNQFAQAIGAPTVEWSTTGGGTLAGTGATVSYTAAAVGTWQIDAAASATVRAQIPVTVTGGGAEAASLALTATPSALIMGGESALVAVARDAGGQIITPLPALTWTVDGGGTITGLGVFRAKVAGTWTVTARASDTVSAQATVTVTAAPLVPDRTYVCAANIGYYQRTIEATSPTNAAMTFTVTTAPQHGTLTIEGGTAFKYIPAANYVGPDSFQIVANDGTQGLPGTIRMNVGINPARSPLVRMDAIEAFDPVKWANDPDYRAAYLANPNPARVWQTAQGGPGVPMLQIIGLPRLTVANGERGNVRVKTAPFAPVTFLSTGDHGVNGQDRVVIVRADGQGVGQISVGGVDHLAYSTIIVGSPMATGTVRVVVVTVPPLDLPWIKGTGVGQ